MSLFDRRSFLTRSLGLAALPFAGAASRALGEDKPAEPPPVERKNLITEGQIAATRKGLEYLRKVQDSKKGSWGGSVQVAVTSLAGCAFLAEGHQPGRGKYGECVQKAINYILNCSKSSRKGYISEPAGDQSRMHGHGFASMFLGEAYGMMKMDDDTRTKMESAIKKAVGIIAYSQTQLGGWGYVPEPTYDEGSVTVAEVMALRSCRNAGFQVDKKVIEKGIGYLKKSANPDGSFKYSLQGGGGGGTFPLTAGAVASMQLFGEYEAKEVKKGLEFLKKNRQNQVGGNWGHKFYGNLYSTMAAYYAGGQFWEDWFPTMRDEYIKTQQGDGSWQGEYDGTYCTAFAVLTLAVPYQYLPIFQA
ncbi:MAG: prenyltransferase/squalene oxidase repeat-containing protein [Planctomycetota bacterium]